MNTVPLGVYRSPAGTRRRKHPETLFAAAIDAGLLREGRVALEPDAAGGGWIVACPVTLWATTLHVQWRFVATDPPEVPARFDLQVADREPLRYRMTEPLERAGERTFSLGRRFVPQGTQVRLALSGFGDDAHAVLNGTILEDQPDAPADVRAFVQELFGSTPPRRA